MRTCFFQFILCSGDFCFYFVFRSDGIYDKIKISVDTLDWLRTPGLSSDRLKDKQKKMTIGNQVRLTLIGSVSIWAFISTFCVSENETDKYSLIKISIDMLSFR